jgi:hypothetical protein
MPDERLAVRTASGRINARGQWAAYWRIARRAQATQTFPEVAMFTFRSVVLTILTATPLTVGGAQVDSSRPAAVRDSGTHPTSATVGGPSDSGRSAMPTDVMGYRLGTVVPLPDPRQGTLYRYERDKDHINVYVSPYQSTDQLGSRDDTTNFVSGDADVFRQSLDAGVHSGVLRGFRSTYARPDNVNTSGHQIAGSVVAAILARRELASEVYAFYGVYALPQGVVRIRAELPTPVAQFGQMSWFAHHLIGEMSRQR